MTIELTTGQKLQVAVILVALGLAGYLIFANTGTTFDHTVNCWTDQRDYPVDAKSHYDKEKNPYDPKKHEDVTVFACSDGKVEFVETPNDPDKHLRVVFQPDKRQPNKVFQYYPDPMDMLAAIKDPVHHALAYAVYLKLYDLATYNRQGSVLAAMTPHLTPDQIDVEKKAREKMDAANSSTDALVAAGTFHPELIDTLNTTLKQFLANSKNILEDAGKQEQARKILALASEYQKRIYQEKGTAIDEYVSALEAKLQEDQKQSLLEIVAKREQKAPPPTMADRRGMRGTTTSPFGGRAGTGAPINMNRGSGGATVTRGSATVTRGTATTNRGGRATVTRGAGTQPAPER